ncbi:MAG TPA: isochorismatase family cysteine hydrolase [Acidimicrobiales bacterium]|jgi:nicotinamidase-related amidase|nr:isochorismatase family cysteine hydrolase [Acidimicrobiales bacterium]
MDELIVGRPVLLVIDMQQDGYLPTEASGIPHMPGFEGRVARTIELVDACRAASVPVIFFQEVHRRDLVDFGRELDGTEGVHCLEDEPGTQLVAELLPKDGDYFIPKRRYSCFFGTDLEILLRGLRAETLLLTGGLTDVCVHYTFADAHQRDYYVRVIEDCVGGSTDARHEASLDAMAYLQSRARCTSDDVRQALKQAAPA